MRKAKWSILLGAFVAIIQIGGHYLSNAENTPGEYHTEDNTDLWNLKTFAPNSEGKYEYLDAEGNVVASYDNMLIENYPRGRIVMFGNGDNICTGQFLIPGTQLLPVGLLAFAYFMALAYLFLGISIIAELFMAGIEQITSQDRDVTITRKNEQTGEMEKVEIRVLVWNPTVANLSLMALGSSAPEILLAVLETVSTLGGCPGELGASTIVGSAAFNLLVISGLSILAVSKENDTDPRRDKTVDPGVKKINDLGVFTISSAASIWAYLWLWIVLMDQNVEMWEAWVTFGSFAALVILCYGADRYKASQDAKNNEEKAHEKFEIPALEMVRTMVAVRNGEQGIDDEKTKKILEFVKETQGTDQIERVDLDKLKNDVEGEGMIARMKYRRQVQNAFSGKRPAIAKGEVLRQEHEHAEFLETKNKNPDFGFSCLHYSVSEASGSLKIVVQNKSGQAGSVRVCTIDAEAKEGEDYEKVDKILEFKKGEKQKFVEVHIKDDDSWEPDEDFFVQLYDTATQEELVGQDTKTRVTIIDDDKPGAIYFKENKAVQADANEDFVEVEVERRNGADGEVTVQYETMELDQTLNTASVDKDFKYAQGTLVFGHNVTLQKIKIEIIKRLDDDGKSVDRDESFAVQLSNVTPAGAKLTKKSFMIVNIVTDVKKKKEQEALAQLLQKMEEQEQITWKQQFINACMLHPTKNEDGDIVDVEPMDAFIHFACIGWKLLFAIVPPPHYCGGWACFIGALSMIGVCTFVVGDFANIFGCSLQIKTTVTAISFVALGTSLPDTFASMTAAVQDKYADPALGNVTGSNAVNVFLGLGLPWLIACYYEQANFDATYENKGYYVPAGALGFSVVVFTILAVTCIAFLVARRFTVGGELGGEAFGRYGSCAFLCTLWTIYIVMSTLQAYGLLGDVSFGIDQSLVHRNEKCWTPEQRKYLETATSWSSPDGTLTTGTAGSLLSNRLGISKCVAGLIKQKVADASLRLPVGAGFENCAGLMTKL